MEIFRSLSIAVEPDKLALMADLVDQSPPMGWTRDRVAEEKMRSAVALSLKPTYCFRCSRDARRPEAMLIVTQKDSTTFFVSNIVPLAKGQLEIREYNLVLNDFYELVVLPFFVPGGATANLSDEQVDLEHWMSHDTAEFLRRFSNCANKWTGSSHPADGERWNAFVVAAHREACKIDASELARWLNEVDGWPAEVATQLALEYESGRKLLAFADGHRRSA